MDIQIQRTAKALNQGDGTCVSSRFYITGFPASCVAMVRQIIPCALPMIFGSLANTNLRGKRFSRLHLRVNREQAVEEISHAAPESAGRLERQDAVMGTPDEFPVFIVLDTPTVIQ